MHTLIPIAVVLVVVGFIAWRANEERHKAQEWQDYQEFLANKRADLRAQFKDIQS